MRKVFTLRVICLMVSVAVIAPLAVPVPAMAQEKVLKLGYSNFFPPVHPISKLSEAWCKEVGRGRSIFQTPIGRLRTPLVAALLHKKFF